MARLEQPDPHAAAAPHAGLTDAEVVRRVLGGEAAPGHHLGGQTA